MSYGIWTVSGSFILQGTRDKLSFGPVRIADASKQAASKHLAKMLNEQFHKELSRLNKHGGPPIRFSNDFALMHLQWEPYAKKEGVAA